MAERLEGRVEGARKGDQDEVTRVGGQRTQDAEEHEQQGHPGEGHAPRRFLDQGAALALAAAMALAAGEPKARAAAPRLPGSLIAATTIRAGKRACASSTSQRTSSQRSGESAKLSSVSQSMVWMVTPLPVVTKVVN